MLSHRSFFDVIGEYTSPSPNTLSPTFELRFARLEYVGDGQFNHDCFRYTGKWWEVLKGSRSRSAS